MVFTSAQQVSFFEDADQMGLSNRNCTLSLINEGIAAIDDLADWDDNYWDQRNSNCKKPDRVQDPNSASNLIAQVPFKISVHSLKRLNITSKLIRYYDSVSIVLSAANTLWVMINNFKIQRKSMVKKSKQTIPDVHKLVKNTTVAKCNDSIKVHAAQFFGARKATFEYFLRTNDAFVAPHPPIMLDHPYSAAAGSIQVEHTLRLSLNYPFYRDTNKSFFDILEVALRGTTYEAPIKPFQSNDNGRGAYKALIAQHAGKDKWVKILWDAKNYVNESKWDVTNS